MLAGSSYCLGEFCLAGGSTADRRTNAPQMPGVGVR